MTPVISKETIASYSDIEISDLITMLQREQRDRVRRKDREAVKEFREAAKNFFARNIPCYIVYHDEFIYLDAEDLHFEVE